MSRESCVNLVNGQGRVSLTNDGDGMTNIELYNEAQKLDLPNFKYFMSNELVKASPDDKECGIVNLDDSDGKGTHHICYWLDRKHGDKFCFDSFGVAPPTELIDYLKKFDKQNILYSTYIIQELNETNCSELSLYVLHELNKGNKFTDTVLDVYRRNTKR